MYLSNTNPYTCYHGYSPLDFTQTDKNYGTVDELRELVNCLHGQGIRVMLGANINNPGYPTLLDALQYGFAPTGDMTPRQAALHDRAWRYDQWVAGMSGWKRWWTRDWLRMEDEGWDQDDPLTTTLLLAPGTVQLFYGDETRRDITEARLNVDGDQAFRSDMNWQTADTTLLKHFRRLGTIRRQHPCIALSSQQTLDPHTCLRTLADDRFLICLKPQPGRLICVAPHFAEGNCLQELYTGQRVVVTHGCVTLNRYENQVALFAVQPSVE